jgi:hypothetical protein
VVIASQTATVPTRAAAIDECVAVASPSWQTLLDVGDALVGRAVIDRGRIATALAGYEIVSPSRSCGSGEPE